MADTTEIPTEVRVELSRLIEIAAVVGGLGRAIEWLSGKLEITAPEPDWHADKVAWVKWYRKVYGSGLKEAVEEGRKRYGYIRISP